MDPTTVLTFATSFGAIVGLMADFVSSRRAGESQTIDEYIDWLRRHEHQQLADAIASDSDLSRSIQTLLAGQHDAVMAKLAELDKVLSSVAQNFSDFAAIAAAVRPESLLSEQAISILRQMNQANASNFLELSTRGGDDFIFMDADGSLQIEETRFIEDDLHTLCAFGLLIPDTNKNGSRIFKITRNGAKVGG